MKKEFFDVPRTHVTTSHTTTQIPIFFFASTSLIINYFIDYDAVLPMLQGTGLLPIRFFNGKALVSLVFFNYHKGSMEDYREVVLGVVSQVETLKPPLFPSATLLLSQKARNLAIYAIDMPVTTMASLAAGREIWGFPKFVTTIPYEMPGNLFKFSVMDPYTNEPIVSVEGEKGIGFYGSPFDFSLFYNRKSDIFRAEVEVDSIFKYSTCKRIQVYVGPSTHRMAANLHKLNLQTTRPFSIISSDLLRTRSNPGKPVAKWKKVPLPYQYDRELSFYKKLNEILGDCQD